MKISFLLPLLTQSQALRYDLGEENGMEIDEPMIIYEETYDIQYDESFDLSYEEGYDAIML